MIKAGDKLVFTNTKNIKPWKHPFKPVEGKVYEVTANYYGYCIIDFVEKELYFSLKDKDATFYIWDWFMHPAEWRAKRIDLILEDD